jgi:hypothetical protein
VQINQKKHHIILQWHGHEMQWEGQEIHWSNSSNNSWNMMSTTVSRMGMMNELQQNKINKTKEKQQSNKLGYRV